jgi:hypothetical protein
MPVSHLSELSFLTVSISWVEFKTYNGTISNEALLVLDDPMNL